MYVMMCFFSAESPKGTHHCKVLFVFPLERYKGSIVKQVGEVIAPMQIYSKERRRTKASLNIRT